MSLRPERYLKCKRCNSQNIRVCCNYWKICQNCGSNDILLHKVNFEWHEKMFKAMEVSRKNIEEEWLMKNSSDKFNAVYCPHCEVESEVETQLYKDNNITGTMVIFTPRVCSKCQAELGGNPSQDEILKRIEKHEKMLLTMINLLPGGEDYVKAEKSFQGMKDTMELM
jgi:hypothetical protein